MDAQQGNPLPENQAAPVNPNPNQAEAKSEEAEAPQVSLHDVLEQFNKRIGVCENLLTEIMKAFQMSGQAINRLESFTFTQMKVLLEKELVGFAEFAEQQKELQGFDNLHDFWGVEPLEEEVSNEEGTSSEE